MEHGLGRRVARHLTPVKPMGLWHVDRLTTAPEAETLGVVLVPHDLWTEHSLSRAVGERLGLTNPIRRFSAADCTDGCFSHLWYSPRPVDLEEIARRLAGIVARRDLDPTATPDRRRHLMDRRYMHAERKLSREEALARIPEVDYLTIEQFQFAVGITDPLPIRKWVAQGRITRHGRDGGGKFARTDVVRFVQNRFSPFSKVEARFFRAGVSLLAASGAVGDYERDLPLLHELLDRLLDGLSASQYERPVRPGSAKLDLRFRAPRSEIEKLEQQFLRAGLVLLAVSGATGDQSADRARLHRALDDYVNGFGGLRAFELAVRTNQEGLAERICEL